MIVYVWIRTYLSCPFHWCVPAPGRCLGQQGISWRAQYLVGSRWKQFHWRAQHPAEVHQGWSKMPSARLRVEQPGGLWAIFTGLDGLNLCFDSAFIKLIWWFSSECISDDRNLRPICLFNTVANRMIANFLSIIINYCAMEIFRPEVLFNSMILQ